ncbi:hypothetical protein HK097_007528, partial [Rhizophlyctis rosea]
MDLLDAVTTCPSPLPTVYFPPTSEPYTRLLTTFSHAQAQDLRIVYFVHADTSSNVVGSLDRYLIPPEVLLILYTQHAASLQRLVEECDAGLKERLGEGDGTELQSLHFIVCDREKQAGKGAASALRELILEHMQTLDKHAPDNVRFTFVSDDPSLSAFFRTRQPNSGRECETPTLESPYPNPMLNLPGHFTTALHPEEKKGLRRALFQSAKILLDQRDDEELFSVDEFGTAVRASNYTISMDHVINVFVLARVLRLECFGRGGSREFRSFQLSRDTLLDMEADGRLRDPDEVEAISPDLEMGDGEQQDAAPSEDPASVATIPQSPTSLKRRRSLEEGEYEESELNESHTPAKQLSGTAAHGSVTLSSPDMDNTPFSLPPTPSNEQRSEKEPRLRFKKRKKTVDADGTEEVDPLSAQQNTTLVALMQADILDIKTSRPSAESTSTITDIQQRAADEINNHNGSYVKCLGEYVNKHFPNHPPPSYKYASIPSHSITAYRCRVEVLDKTFEPADPFSTQQEAAEDASRLALLYAFSLYDLAAPLIDSEDRVARLLVKQEEEEE